MNSCAPGRNSDKYNHCFDIDDLIEIVSAYNRYVTKQQLLPDRYRNDQDNSLKRIQIRKNKEYLIVELHKRFENKCKGNDQCLLEQQFANEISKEIRDNINKNAFRSVGPTENIEWLSTSNINEILTKYEQECSDFKFVGAVPLDCHKYSFCSLHNINFNDLWNKGKTKIGIVYNLDRLGQRGSHWVAMYIDAKTGNIEFCDSQGGDPHEEIKATINNFKRWYKSKNKVDVDPKINTKSYQKDKSECGVYSCNFIIRRLRGESFESIIKDSLDFEGINSCRNVYFRNKPSPYPVHHLCDPGVNVKHV